MNHNDQNSISWFVEEMHFETIREAREWVYSGAYNDIGYFFDGYKTKDPKLAYALLFELVRSNTIHGHRHDVHCDEEHLEGSITYKVWITNKKYDYPKITNDPIK
ncbi:hypothetical protein JCM10914A_51350 [Paenibacillus sp. JCM 10914]|uniref:hypothetical protein n=1 Tax=Paenibacillus sp. JCM 10914 TaxID=1236974 RepID=UPI0006899036|nr:hypothetical protein [Paenibacillus sp. JCM 10914]